MVNKTADYSSACVTPIAAAIVVLGCSLRPDGTPSGRLRRRVALGVRLYEAEAAPLLVMSGGGSGPRSEAEAMRDLASGSGVPEAALLCETASRNTCENALYTARLLRECGITRIVLVTDRTHLFRAQMLFRLAGLKVVGSAGAPARSVLHTLLTTLYEILALPRSLWRWIRVAR